MNARNLGILAGLTAVVGGLAALSVYMERTAVAPKAETGVVLPGLAAKVNDVSTVEVTSGDKVLTVHRDPAKADAGWTVKELGDYPAKFEKVKALIVGLADLEKVEAKTDVPESYEKIGVQQPATGNTATLVKVSNASGPAATLIVGKSKPAGDKPQVYVRIPDQKQSWLAKGEVATTADPLDWVDREVMKLDSTRVKGVVVAQPDGAKLAVSRPDKQGAYAVADVPEGRALKTASAGAPVAGGLAYLTFDGVKPVGEIAWDTGGQATAEFRTFDGLVVTATTVEADGKVWAKFAAAFDESAVPPATSTPPVLTTKPDGTEPTEEEKAAAAKKAQDDAESARKSEIERVKKETETLNAKLSPWAYQVPKTKGDVLRRKMEDLLAEVPKEGAKPEGAPADQNGDQPDDGGDVPLEPERPQGPGDGSGG